MDIKKINKIVKIDIKEGLKAHYPEVFEDGKYMLKVQKSIYDGIIKESNIEEEFAKAFDKDSRIKLFIKLPDWYAIETPAGNYTPDWATVIEKVQDGHTEEKIKIKSAKKRFELIRDSKFVAPVKDFDSFESKW